MHMAQRRDRGYCKTNKLLSPPSPSGPCAQCAGYRRTAPPPVCTFCLRTTLRSSFPRVPSRIGHLHINPASPTQFWMRAPLSSTPILPVLPILFRPRLELSASTVHISRLAHPLLRLLAFFPYHPTRLHPGLLTTHTTPQLTVAPASALLVSPSAPGSPEC
ncbi:hypothetical protein B0H13DRAFT_1112956 [Mycena leptocephala]|nr:hypothetical protein B0H13DRAFT_1112956 [Mycena leptocephala]